MAHRIISRAESGLRPALRRSTIATPTPELWLHHSAGALDAGGNGVWWDDVRGIQEFHMRPVAQGGRGWSDIAYSFLVGGGLIFEGRGVGVAGGHTAGRNTISHAICLIGNYEVMEPTDEDLDAIAWLTAHGLERGWWSAPITGPHKDAPGASTACCGRHLIARIPDLRRMIAAGPTTTEDDMPYTEAQLRKMMEDSARRVLNEATVHGQTSGAGTIRAIAARTAQNVNQLNEVRAILRGVAAQVGVDVDEEAIAAALVPALLEGLEALGIGTIVEGAVTAALEAATGNEFGLDIAAVAKAAADTAIADFLERLTSTK